MDEEAELLASREGVRRHGSRDYTAHGHRHPAMGSTSIDDLTMARKKRYNNRMNMKDIDLRGSAVYLDVSREDDRGRRSAGSRRLDIDDGGTSSHPSSRRRRGKVLTTLVPTMYNDMITRVLEREISQPVIPEGSIDDRRSKEDVHKGPPEANVGLGGANGRIDAETKSRRRHQNTL